MKFTTILSVAILAVVASAAPSRKISSNKETFITKDTKTNIKNNANKSWNWNYKAQEEKNVNVNKETKVNQSTDVRKVDNSQNNSKNLNQSVQQGGDKSGGLINTAKSSSSVSQNAVIN